jgi:hypothetical protein
MMVATMGRPLQIGLLARYLDYGAIERKCLPGFEGKLFLWHPVGNVSSVEAEW